MVRIVCRDCGADMQLHRDGRKKYFRCARYPKCGGYLGAHRKTGEPMGRAADAETRRARSKAHRTFDKLWKQGSLTRAQAYIWMRREMKLKESEAHIGRFSMQDCKKLMEALRRARKAGMFKRRERDKGTARKGDGVAEGSGSEVRAR